MKILVTGFAPFGADERNASWDAVSMLPDMVGGAALIKCQLPVEYDTVGEVLASLLAREKPDAVICVGQAGGRSAVTPEKVAINWKQAAIADNAGVLYAGEKIRSDGTDAYFSSLPIEEILTAMRGRGVPAAVSFTAGAYVCNCTMYHLMALLAGTDIPGGFIHVPYASYQVLEKPQPSLPLESISAALLAAAEVLAKTE